MIQEIRENIENIIDELFLRMPQIDYNAFILFIARADYQPELKAICGSGCVIDYMGDVYKDETREGFYLRYMNRNYHTDGFSYQSISGIDDLSIELMIYSHVWESSYFMKALVRIANILSGNGYDWSPDIPERGKWDFMHKKVITPMETNYPEFAELIRNAYNSDLRDAFAHALYNVDTKLRTITTYPKRAVNTISFEDFQLKFLKSVTLINFLHNAIEGNHIKYAAMETCLTQPFLSKDEVMIQVVSRIVERSGYKSPEYKLVKVKDNV